ncbi:MAG: hypothetical protein AB1393_13755, partial [Candidatus Edwardsbacteria bacterium]
MKGMCLTAQKGVRFLSIGLKEMALIQILFVVQSIVGLLLKLSLENGLMLKHQVKNHKSFQTEIIIVATKTFMKHKVITQLNLTGGILSVKVRGLSGETRFRIYLEGEVVTDGIQLVLQSGKGKFQLSDEGLHIL